MAACPCGGYGGSGGGLNPSYNTCCGRWHAGPQHLQAPNAEALMRSRYSAYVHGLSTYLLDTWHVSTRPTEPPLFEAGVQWLGLEVKQHTPTENHSAEVEFVARSKLGGRAHRLHEKSHFVFESGRWYYVDGRAE